MLLKLFHVAHSEALILVSPELMMSSVYNLHKYGYAQINCCSTSVICCISWESIIAERCVCSKEPFCVVAVYEAINGCCNWLNAIARQLGVITLQKEWILLLLCHKPSNAKEKKIVSLLCAGRVWQSCFCSCLGFFFPRVAWEGKWRSNLKPMHKKGKKVCVCVCAYSLILQ